MESGVRRRAFERKFLRQLLFIFYLPPAKIRRLRERSRELV